MNQDEKMTAQEPVAAYATNTFTDVMMMLYTMPITTEVKKHVGQRLVEESTGRYLIKAFERIDHLSRLKADWDGHGALPISKEVITNLKRVLMLSRDEDWKEWMIGPDSNATLGLQSKTTDACISIGSEEYSYYADINGKEFHASHVKFTPSSFLSIMRKLV